MRLIIAISLLFVVLFVAGFAYAAPSQSCNCPNGADRWVTSTTSQRIFLNPHTGWITVPVEEAILRCPAQL